MGQGSSMGLSIGGMAEQDIAGYILAKVNTERLKTGLREYEAEAQKGYNAGMSGYQPYADKEGKNYQSLVDAIRGGAYDTPVQSFNEPNAPDAGKFKFDWNLQQDPSYKFRQQEGQNAILTGSAARGSLLSGATQKALVKYSSDLASLEYNNAYNRAYNAQSGEFRDDRNFQYGKYSDSRNNAYQNYTDVYNRTSQQKQGQYSRMSDLANTGMQANLGMADLTRNYYNTLADLRMQRRNVEAAGYQAAANVAYQQGEHLQEIGGMSGGSGKSSSSGGSSGGFDMSSLSSMFGSGGSGAEGMEASGGSFA